LDIMLKYQRIILRLDSSNIDVFKKIAQNAYPNESVALFFGQVERRDVNNTNNASNTSNTTSNIKNSKNDKKKYLFVYSIQKVDEYQSSEPSPIEFVLGDLESLAQKWIQAESIGLKFIGIFHSHPVNAHYSGKDETYMAQISQAYQNIAWLIYGNKKHDFRCFLHFTGKVIEIKIEYE